MNKEVKKCIVCGEKIPPNNTVTCSRKCYSIYRFNKYNEIRKKQGLICPVCNKVLKHNQKKFCSKDCHFKFKRKLKVCEVCKKEFYRPPSANVYTCSKECSSIRRKQKLKDGTLKFSIQEAVEKQKTMPEFTKTEFNVNSKYWVLKTPEGEILKITNLKHFIRNNIHLFDTILSSTYCALRELKYNNPNKDKDISWRGWKLLDWSDEKIIKLSKDDK